MQNKAFYNFIKRLSTEGRMNASQIGSTVRNSADFTTLINGNLIEFKKSITGGGSIVCIDKKALEDYFFKKFPNELQQTFTAVDNVHAFRNTKAGKRKSQSIILIRGKKQVEINGLIVQLERYSTKFGTFSTVLHSLETERVCFVENLDSYLVAEQVIDSSYVFIHSYGGLGKSVISKVVADEILVFPDYDFKGLHNYLMVKSIFPKTTLFIPNNYDDLFETESRTIKTKHGREQQPSKEVLSSHDATVVKIREEIFMKKKFLEQQALFK